jgi:hypothetical protein
MLRSMSVRVIPRQHDAVLVKTNDVAIREGAVDGRTHGRLPALRAVGEKKGLSLKKISRGDFSAAEYCNTRMVWAESQAKSTDASAQLSASDRLDTVSTKRFTEKLRNFSRRWHNSYLANGIYGVALEMLAIPG